MESCNRIPDIIAQLFFVIFLICLLRRYLLHIINGNILYMQTFNHVLVVHILVNIVIIAKCEYVERYIALANVYEKYLRNIERVFVNLQ